MTDYLIISTFALGCLMVVIGSVMDFKNNSNKISGFSDES